MGSSSAADVSPIFRIPLEMREEIFSHLLLSQHVHTSTATPGTSWRHRSNRIPPTYVDTRIYLPSRLPTNVLCVCKQLREEGLAYHAHRLNSSHHVTIVDDKPVEGTTSHKLGDRNDANNDGLLERLHDGDTVRVTLEVLRHFRETRGNYTHKRREPSPLFLGLTPLLGRLKKIKFTVWPGYHWWSGEITQRPSKMEALQRVMCSKMAADKDGKAVRPTLWELYGAMSSPEPRLDPLCVAIDALLQHLPLVEDVKIDLLIHDICYCKWHLPEIWWEGIRNWLDGPISSIAKDRVTKVERRFIVVYHGHVRHSGTLLHQRESIQQDNAMIRVERGTRKYEDDWNDTQQELSFTELFERPACLSSTQTSTQDAMISSE